MAAASASAALRRRSARSSARAASSSARGLAIRQRPWPWRRPWPARQRRRPRPAAAAAGAASGARRAFGRGGGCSAACLLRPPWRPARPARRARPLRARALPALRAGGASRRSSSSWRRISSAWRRASSSRRCEFGLVDHRRRRARLGSSAPAGASSRLTKVRFLRTSTWIVRALPVASACLISLVDFLRVSVIFLRSARRVPWLARRKPSRRCLVGLGQRVVGRLLGHAGALQLLEQRRGRAVRARRRTGRRWSLAMLISFLGMTSCASCRRASGR